LTAPQPSPTYEPALRGLLGAAAVVIVVAGLKLASAVFVPVTIALFLAMVSLPLLEWLVRHRVNRAVAVTITALADLGVIVFFGWLLAVAVHDVTLEFPRLAPEVATILDRGVAWLEARGFPASDWVSPASFDPGALVDLAGSTFVGVASFLTEVVLIALLIVFMLLESLEIGDKLAHALRTDRGALGRYSRITRDVRRYLLLKTLVSVATGLSVGIWVAVLGLAFPVFWGFLAFLCHFIPNVGALLAAVPAIAFSAIQLGTPRTIAVAAGYAVANLLWGNIVEPNLMGRRLRLSPLVVFVSLVFWGWVWGPAGMVLSVPITMAFKIAFENSPNLKWLALLLEQGPRRTPPASTAEPSGPGAGAGDVLEGEEVRGAGAPPRQP
jgi:predicted PurR-regulated permease PerM